MLSVGFTLPHVSRSCIDIFLGAFVAAPIGGLLWGFGACGLRLATLYIFSRVKGHRFDALDRPIPHRRSLDSDDREGDRVVEHTYEAGKAGKFF